MARGKRAQGAGDNRTVRLDGAKVRARRKAKGLSRAKLAELSAGGPHSLTEVTIKRIEHGDSIYLNTASSVAALLETPLPELWPDASAEALVDPPRPMIAVMQLQAAGDDIGSFADGLAEDLITRMSRFWFPIVARSSSLTPVDSDPRAAAQALGAKYFISGSVRRANGKIRFTAQLADAGTGAVLAQHHEPRPIGEVFALQDQLAASMLSALGPHLVEAEAKRFERCNPKDLDAWQEGLLGLWHFYRRTNLDNARARVLLSQALRRDQHMPLAWYTLALTHQQDLINQWSEDPRRSIAELQTVSREFERLYPEEAWAQTVCAYLDVYLGQRDSAIARLSAAIETDPNACLAYALYGQTLAMAQEPDRALEQFEVALRLNPKDTERWSTLTGMALTHFAAGNYELAIASARDAVRARPSAAFPYTVLASAHAHLGKHEGAREALRTMLHVQPNMSVRGIVSVMGSTDEEIGKRFLEGLKMAGLVI